MDAAGESINKRRMCVYSNKSVKEKKNKNLESCKDQAKGINNRKVLALTREHRN